MGRLLRTELVKASLPLGQIFTLPVTKGFSNRSSTFTFNQWAFDSSYSELEYPNISSERFLDYIQKIPYNWSRSPLHLQNRKFHSYASLFLVPITARRHKAKASCSEPSMGSIKRIVCRYFTGCPPRDMLKVVSFTWGDAEIRNSKVQETQNLDRFRPRGA
jgi:hypothetical protein